jgi:hypothetical protein
MTVASQTAGTDFRIGDVAGRAFSISLANFPFFFAITFVVALPNLLFLLNQSQPGNVAAAGIGWRLAVSLIAVMILSQIGQAIIVFGAFQQLRGLPLRPGEALQRALARFFPLIGLAILYSLGIALGTMLLIVPGVILLVMWAVVVPVCVLEGLGPVASMGRSRELTKGHRWQIFGLLLVLMVVSVVGNKLVGLSLAPADFVAAALGSVVWAAVWAIYWHCLLIMVYHDLRIAKEAISTEQIAAVFN